MPNNAFDSLVEKCLNDDEKHLNSVLEHQKLNFILIPAIKKGHLHCIHHCSFYEDDLTVRQIIIGVHGMRFTSPWKVLPVEKANVPLKLQRIYLNWIKFS